MLYLEGLTPCKGMQCERTMFTKITSKHVEKIKELCGAGDVFCDEETLALYAHDETEDLKFAPEVVVKPRKKEQISALMKFCYEESIPVTPRGGGTGLSGGALPVHGGVVLSVERMNKILQIDTENFVAVVQPGVITEAFQNEVEKLGLYYPPDPASRGSCQLGGNIAENAGGPHAVKYGVTSDYVMGLEVVLPNGDIVRAGGKLFKNVTGYDLTKLFVGSEGTLGIVTEAVLKLLPLPPYRELLLAPFPSIQSAVTALQKIFTAKIIPSSAEFMVRDAVKFAEERLGKTFPEHDAEAHLLLESDGTSKNLVEEEAVKMGKICMENGALTVLVADNENKQKELWALRRCIGEAVKKMSTYKEEDTVVPRARLPELMKEIQKISEKYHLRIVCYGHAGDGNIHANILKGDMEDEKWSELLPVVIRELFKEVVALGGMISGEHGIGFVQKDYMPIALSPAELSLMKSIKKTFDPKGILNPGKLFP